MTGMSSTPIWSPDRYARAYAFAAEAHRGQCVPGSNGLPYVMHVSLVCMEVMTTFTVEQVADPNLAMECALLHDVIEDTDIDRQQLADEFGTAVADGVQALSKDSSLARDQRMADSLLRIRAQPHEVWLVKLADRITNLAPPPAKWTREKCMHYHGEAAQIDNALGDASSYLRARIRERMRAYEAYI